MTFLGRRLGPGHVFHVVILLVSAVFAAADVVRAQSIRVTGVTSAQSVDVRPLVDDSVPIGLAIGDGPYRQLADGRLVRCVEGEAFCRFRRSGDRVTAMPVVQDLQLTAWGFGRGVSVHADLRGRQSLGGSEFLWPRANDHFDALAAYVEVDRTAWRARLGRQWAQNGLGLYNYDGGSLVVRRGTLTAEAFGGSSLVEGLNETHTGGALGTVDDLPPDDHGYVLGVRVAARPWTRTALAGVYQRVIRADRAGMYSERIALDGSTRAAGSTIDAQWTYDLIAGEVDDARLRATRELPRRASATLELRRHRPFFESWTIWGAFAPVGFDEARAIVGWRDQRARISLDVSGGWRQYDAANTGLATNPLRDNGWRAGAGAEWTPSMRWMAHADYDVDIGFGASRSDASAGLRWSPNDGVFFGGTASALQNIYEFRVGTGTVVGVSLQGGLRVARDARVTLDGALYANRASNNAPSTDWSQRRVAMRFEWTWGEDPGDAAIRQRRGRAP
jgi:hypothetical protein